MLSDETTLGGIPEEDELEVTPTGTVGKQYMVVPMTWAEIKAEHYFHDYFIETYIDDGKEVEKPACKDATEPELECS